MSLGKTPNHTMLVGVDPSSKKLAMVAKHPLGDTFYSEAVDLGGSKFEPINNLDALHAAHAFIDAVDDMCVPSAPRCVFIEAPVIGRGGARSTMVQAFVSGVVQACFLQAGYSVELVQNTTWKREVCGNGSAKKPEVRRNVQLVWPKFVHAIGQDQDLIDAAAITIYGFQLLKRAELV